MSMDQPRRPTRAPGGAARAPRSASPAIAVVVALLAAVLGFVILRALDDDDTVSTGNGGDTTDQPDETTADGSTTTASTTTTLPVVDKAAFQVLVANASGVSGSARGLSDQLAAMGYQLLEPANAIDPTPQPTTVVYYFSTAQIQGEDVSRAIGLNGLAQVLPATLPVEQAAFANGTVLIMLGTDLAGATIPTTTAPAATLTQPTVAGGASPNETVATTG